MSTKEKHEEILKIPGHKVNANVARIRFYLTPVRMTIRQNTNNTQCGWGCRESFQTLLV
jgi:hypothetical protein